MSDTPIINMLKSFAKDETLRFCMPGHKGKKTFLAEKVNKYDITELQNTDNLYNPNGVIAESEKRYADYIGAKDSFFLVNGSSCGVHAAVLSVLNPGDEVIAVRDFHLSAVHAFALTGAVPHFIYTGANNSGIFNTVDIEQVKNAIKTFPNSKAIYLTYPDYWGRCADLSSICKEAHNAGMKVICDAAHAAAFDFSQLLPTSPSKAGCDIWTVSLHKTLAAMNQCAVLCTGEKSDIDRTKVRSRLNLIQTTSPSYILLASNEYAIDYMIKYGSQKLAQLTDWIKTCEIEIEKLGDYKCLSDVFSQNDSVFEYDELKFTIDVTKRGITGFYAAEQLAKTGIYVESADLWRILLICTVMDNKSDFDRLLNALSKIKANEQSVKTQANYFKFDTDSIFKANMKMNIREAVFAPRKNVTKNEAIGCVSAVCAGAYPPGVPVLIPGQQITADIIGYLDRLDNLGYSIFGIDKSISVVNS